MARPDRDAFVSLGSLSWDTITTIDPGNIPAETPYLWTIFFRADGSTLSVNAGASISGAAVVEATQVSREDLGGHGVALGESVSIPSRIGLWSATLKPIPVDPVLQPLLGSVDLPAQFGVIVAVMVQNGYLTDGLADVGYQALVTFVQNAIAKLLANLGPNHTTITPEDIASVTDGASGAVTDAIRQAASTWAEIEILLEGTDLPVGNRTLLFDQDQFTGNSANLAVDMPITASSWQWSVHGSIQVTDTCPATALASTVESADSAEALAALRLFRDQGLRMIPSGGWWWDRMSRHSAELATLVRCDADLASQLRVLGPLIPQALHTTDQAVPATILDDLHTLAMAVVRRGSAPLATDARYLAAMFAAMKGLSLSRIEPILLRGRLQATAVER